MNRIIPIAATMMVALTVVGCTVLPKNEIRTETIIPAPPSDVWSVLTDTAGHAQWNPFIVEMQGTVLEGERLTNTMAPSEGDRQTFRPKIIRVEPNEELRWLGRAGIPGIFDGEHYFLLKPVPEGTRFIHGERFSGFALWFIDTDQFEENFTQMNSALSRRVLETQTQE